MAQPIIVITTDELTEIISQAVRKEITPLLDELDDLKVKVAQRCLLLTVRHVVAQCNVSDDTVRNWINKGVRVSGKSRPVKLKTIPGFSGNHLIYYDDLISFLNHFPRTTT